MLKKKSGTLKPVRGKSGARSLVQKLRNFLHSLSDRYQHILGILDEALHSEDLKEKKWAVDVILKNTGTEARLSGKNEKQIAKAPSADTVRSLDSLSNEEVLARIRAYLSSPVGQLPETDGPENDEANS